MPQGKVSYRMQGTPRKIRNVTIRCWQKKKDAISVSLTYLLIRRIIERTETNNHQRKTIMSTPTKAPEHLLLFRGNDWHKGLSPQEMQAVASKWMAWFKRLTDEGICLAGQPLEREGRLVSGKNGRVVSDGPFAESKEAIGGYFLLRVNTMDEAVAIAKECPGLAYGIQVEVRPVREECPLAEESRAQLASASATA